MKLLLFLFGVVCARKSLPIEEQFPIEDIDYDINEETNTTGFRSVPPVDLPQTRISYEGFQLWKVVLNTNEKKRALIQLRETQDISNWGGNHTVVDILVKPKSKEKVTQIFNRKKINYEIILQDLQTAIDQENPPQSEEEEELSNRRGYKLTWQAYHRAEDIHGYLDYLEATYPKLCKVVTIGKSVEGRPLKLLRISNGNPANKAIWMDGGIHAREWISPATVTYLINYLVENYENEPALRNINWHIIPLINPDGYEYTHTIDRLWRKNRAQHKGCVGTDLNRNFGYHWGGKGSGKHPCQEIYAGIGPFSEPETTAIKNYIMSTPTNWTAYLSFHSYGQYILYPWGYDQVLTFDHKDLHSVGIQMANEIKRASGQLYKVGTSAIVLYAASGGSDDWAKGAAGFKYAYTVELRDQGRYGFVLPASYIIPTAKETLAAVRVLVDAVNA